MLENPVSYQSYNQANAKLQQSGLGQSLNVSFLGCGLTNEC